MQDLNLFGIYTDALNRNNIKYFVTGSVAAIVYGEPRLTNDIDLVIFLLDYQIDAFIKAFPPNKFYCPPEEVIKIEMKRTSHGHLNLIHHETSFKADIYFAGDEELQLWAYENRNEIEFLGNKIYIAPPEYVIIKKLEFYKEGKAGKHLTDINNMLTNSNEMIKYDFLLNKIKEFGLNDVWDLVGKGSL